MVSARTRFAELSPTARRRALMGVLAGLLAIVAVLALVQEGRARARMVDDATASATAAVRAALVPELTLADASRPATGDRYAALALATEQILADGTVEAVTVWAGDGTVLFADDASLVGDQMRAMRPTVLTVVGDEAGSDIVRGLVRSFVPVELAPGISVAVEVDRGVGPVAAAADPWRLMALLAGAGAMLLSLLLAHTFTRAGRRAEGFDEETLRAALIGRSRAERALGEAVERRDTLEGELERTRAALRETEERAREATRTADDTPRLREHLTLTAEDLQRVEQERDALRERLHEAGRAVEAEAVRGREELAGALGEIERLEGVKLSLQERAAKAEDAVTHLTKQVADLQARPDIEAELVSVRRHAESTQRELAQARRRAEEAERRNAELEDVSDQLQTRLHDLERRPDLSAKLDAASAALDIARDQIRALTARTGEANAEAAELRAELDGVRASRATELEEARDELAAARAAIEAATRESRAVVAENEDLRDEVESLRRESDAAGQMIAGAKAELLQTAEHMKELKARAKDAEAELDRERAAWAKELEEVRANATADLERDQARAETEAIRAWVERVRLGLGAAQAEIAETVQAVADVTAARSRDAAALAHAIAERERLGSRVDGLEREIAEAREDLAALELAAKAEADAARVALDALRAVSGSANAEIDALRAEREALTSEGAQLREESEGLHAEAERLRAESDQLRTEIERARADHAAAESRSADAERRREEAVRGREDAELEAAEAATRADRAEELLADTEARLAEAEARFHRVRFAEAVGGGPPVRVSAGPDGPAVEIRSDPPSAAANGSGASNRVATNVTRRATKVEVDTLVRRVIQESWSDRGRMVSVYAEPVSVEVAQDAVERILGSLLERSVGRTSEGNRIVVHVEREADGVLLSIEDGRPPEDDAAFAETQRLAVDLGGWARVEEHLGGGSIARVHLPRSAHADAGAPS